MSRFTPTPACRRRTVPRPDSARSPSGTRRSAASGWALAAPPKSTGVACGLRYPAVSENPLCAADRRDAELDRLLDERVADLWEVRVAVVEAPCVARPVVEIRVVGEDLPRDDRVVGRDRRHRVEVRLQVPDVRERLRVEQDPAVAADGAGEPPRLLHDRGRLRAALRRDRERREHDHRRVALEEQGLQEVLDVEAAARVGQPAAPLREPAPEVASLRSDRAHRVVEEVALDVEHELVAGQRGARRVDVDVRRRRHLEVTAGRAAVDGARDSSALHAFRTINVVAAPQSERRNCRRDIPVRRALRSHSSRASRTVSSSTGVSGRGTYSPLEHGPNLIGRSGSSSSAGTTPPTPRAPAGVARPGVAPTPPRPPSRPPGF